MDLPRGGDEYRARVATRAVLAWRSAADRLPAAEHRAQVLELAGRLHADLTDGRVLWFGADVPA